MSSFLTWKATDYWGSRRPLTTRSHWWINESRRMQREVPLNAKKQKIAEHSCQSGKAFIHHRATEGICRRNNDCARFSFIRLFLASRLRRRRNVALFCTWPRVTPVAIRCSRPCRAGEILLRNVCGAVKRSHLYHPKVFASEGRHNKTCAHVYICTYKDRPPGFQRSTWKKNDGAHSNSGQLHLYSRKDIWNDTKCISVFLLPIDSIAW